MSKLPLGPIFSAAHISKWDALPKDTPAHTPLELKRTISKSQSNYDGSESSRLGRNVFSECEITVRVAGSVSTDAREHVGQSTAKMPAKTYTWITLWFLLTAPIILWDASYCFMRPRSMVGGDLHWIWGPYEIYQEVDYVYGLKALEENNGFTNAQALLNLVETTLNLVYVYLAHVSYCPSAPLVGFTGATMTLSKTMLYWAQEYYCGGCSVGHNAFGTLFLYWILPNALWLAFPSMIMWRLGSDILGSLFVASRITRKAADGKTQ